MSKNTVLFKLSILMMLFLVYSAELSAETLSALKGKVVNSDKEALHAVTVQIKSLKMQTRTDKNGEYIIKNIPLGTYQVHFFRVGVRPETIETEIKTGENILDAVINDVYELKENIVVTGTRTAKQIESNPIATEVVTDEEIKNAAHFRLDNVLNEELGMCLVEDHGKGIQIQGLDPDYALILINGEPLIGRNGGILDLKRLAVGNIKRIEVVKGPSSCLYGSNALAGVINLITDEPEKPFSMRASSRFESYNTIDLSAETGLLFGGGLFGANIFVNRLSSDGFSLKKKGKQTTQESYGKAVPEYVNYSMSGEGFWKLSPVFNARFSARMNTESQINLFDITQSDKKYIIDDNSSLDDINLSFSIKHQMYDAANAELRAYYTNYKTKSDYTYRDIHDSLYESYDFEQSLAKIELQSNIMLGYSHVLTFGGGLNYEEVSAQRIGAGSVTANSYFAFMQEDWLASKELNVIGSIRYDAHSDYESRFSPKIAASYSLFDGFIIKGSIGSGFKAPTFQQLYLVWSNAIAGYSVFGVEFFGDEYQKLLKDGVIGNTIIDPASIKPLKPETSISYNFGMNWDITKQIETKVNLFRNNIIDMIDTQPVANKTSGAQVFTYFNLSRVHTQGVEFNASYKPIYNIKMSIGYQYLEAVDENIVDQINDGKIFKRTSDGSRKVKLSEYGGIINRSKHSGNFKIEYNNYDYGFNVFLRGILRGRYGFADLDGNTIIDDDKEYAPAYQLWNLTCSYDFLEHFTVQTGIDNMFDTYDPQHLFSNPGRTYFVNLAFRY